jgi:hypothetical protein
LVSNKEVTGIDFFEVAAVDEINGAAAGFISNERAVRVDIFEILVVEEMNGAVAIARRTAPTKYKMGSDIFKANFPLLAMAPLSIVLTSDLERR